MGTTNGFASSSDGDGTRLALKACLGLPKLLPVISTFNEWCPQLLQLA